jgi:hypothetical protein
MTAALGISYIRRFTFPRVRPFMSQAFRRPIILAGALGAFVAGCDDSHAGPDLSGTWTGVVAGICQPSVSMQISESNSGVLTGTAKTTFPGACGFGTFTYFVAGEHHHPAVTMNLESTLKADLVGLEKRTVTATVKSADSLTAKLDTFGLTLVRSP